MALKSPNLDDRSFAQLVDEARARIVASSPDWTDLSPSDPGITLIEVFAFLTETLIYRSNRISEKTYVAFLHLLGVQLLPPEVASAILLFKLARASQKPIEIPRGTQVSVSRPESGSEAPVFVVARTASIPAGETRIEVPAYHCDLVEAELLGKGTGLGGLSVSVARPPIIAATQGELDLVVAVEATSEELGDRAPAREFGGKSFRIWREVPNFTQLGPDTYVYIADRVAGTITFAPSLRVREENGSLAETLTTLAAVPPAGREIRAWYGRGGGPLGNVAANTLTLLKSSIPGISVTNPAAAVGGRSAESVDNALIRGPQEVHSLQRAVTARDFELLARRSGAVSRARAFTKAYLWTYATPGTVEVILVPNLDEQQRSGRVSREQLETLQTEEARQRIQVLLDEHRPLGTTCVVSWARYKTVKVRCRIVAHPDENPIELQSRIRNRLYDIINPLPSGSHSGWRFGQALRSSHLYDAALAEPGVIYVDKIQLIVEDVPEGEIQCLAADAFQPNTWYAGSHSTLYRSMDDGDGWAAVGQFPDQMVYSVQPHPSVPGMIAVASRNLNQQPGSRIHVSFDCGENWVEKAVTAFEVADMAWVVRDGSSFLFLATSAGLFELSMLPDASVNQVFVRPDDEKIGYYAVAAAHLKSGVTVAIASRAMGGVFVSDESGKSNTFRNIGKAGEDVRVLAVQTSGTRSFLWAGLATPVVGDPGKGCSFWAILGNGQDPPEDWQKFDNQWIGGSCVELAFQGDRVLAATYDAGVLWLEQRATAEPWHAPSITCGLPQATREHPFDRVDALATDGQRKVLLAGSKTGIFRSNDGGEQYDCSSRKVFTDKVTLPPNWLFCSGEHDIAVVTQDENSTD